MYMKYMKSWNPRVRYARASMGQKLQIQSHWAITSGDVVNDVTPDSTTAAIEC